MIKHVSFDVWNTLISANPEFAAARAEMFADWTQTDPTIVKAEYTQLKHRSDSLAESAGIALPTHTLVRILLGSLMVGEPNDDQVRRCVLELNALFAEHPPILHQQNIDLMAELRSMDITVSIGSNSNFITGKVMNPWLNEQTGGAFSFGIYSDLVRAAKPSAAFFGHVIDGTRSALKHPITINEILHVGDSARCDLWGAQQIGINALLTENPISTYNTVIEYINEVNHV